MSTNIPEVEALYNTGRWLMDTGRTSNAMDVFRAMLLATPQDERGWLALGLCHEQLGQTRVALDLYLGASLAGPSPRCHIARARLLRVSGADDDAIEVALEAAINAAEAVGDDDAKAIIEDERRAA